MKKKLSYLELITIIEEIKKTFESQLEKRLSLWKIQCPLFVKSKTGLQDDLKGIEKSVSFKYQGEFYEVVHSLAKWKREAISRYQVPLYQGILTDMKAIRKDEVIDQVHSLYVEQWDWEKVIKKEDRTISYLESTVKTIYKAIRQTAIILKKKYSFLDISLPKQITIVTSQELEDMYKDKTPKEREYLITKKHKAVFIIGIGDKLLSGIEHDFRSPDYDDWQLDGDILIYSKKLDREVELSSMGIRVDKETLLSQLEKSGKLERIKLPYHQKIIKEELPYTIGGGIGISRLLMLILDKSHIAEVQSSTWPDSLQDKMLL